MSNANEFTDIITINDSVGTHISYIQAEVDPKLFKGKHFMAIHTTIIADHGWIILRRKDLEDMIAELDRIGDTVFIETHEVEMCSNCGHDPEYCGCNDVPTNQDHLT
jgi:hypothetical protein